MLGLVLIDPVFAKSLGEYRAVPTDGGNNVRSKFLNAARVVENLICTSRESLIGSSSWRGEFFDELCGRPFYTVLDVCKELVYFNWYI